MKWLVGFFLVLAFASFSQEESVAVVEAFEASKTSNSRIAYNKTKEMYHHTMDKDHTKQSIDFSEADVDRMLVVARYFRDMEFVTELYQTESKQGACGCGAQCNKHHHEHD